ncbi:flagellar assembly protein FliW [Oscillospiraceae bacterium MB08-C2-2]|nr:flagellar assembly protein FliW [Oscillospiraceae bacterium MB08-C2-2]
MIVNSAVFGEMDVDVHAVYNIPGGLLGFEDQEKYALITKQDEDVTLKWFQAVEDVVPCFVVFDPFDIIEGYDPIVEPSDLKHLGCKTFEELTFLVIAVVPEDMTQTTVNLKSPIILNKSNQLARQVILANRDYPVRFSLFPQPAFEEPAVAAESPAE